MPPWRQRIRLLRYHRDTEKTSRFDSLLFSIFSVRASENQHAPESYFLYTHNEIKEVTTMSLPNIFNFATSELSQDAAIAYHIAWADPKYKSTHPAHHALGIDLLKLFAGESGQKLSIGHINIDVGLQYDHVDIWIYIGCEAVLIVEDKTNSSEHGNQIDRYRGVANEWLDPEGKQWGSERVIVAYLKTGNESQSSKPKAEYIHQVNRSELLRILSQHQNTNDQIFDQFRMHLRKWEDATKSYLKIPVAEEWPWQAIEGFYSDLELYFNKENIEISNWKYVSNPAGGFLAFYWNWVWIAEFNCHLYLQLEHANRLQIRVSDAQDSDGNPILADAALRWKLLGHLQEIARGNKYSAFNIYKSGRYRAGATGGVAYVENYIATCNNGLVDMRTTSSNLKLLMELLFEASS